MKRAPLGGLALLATLLSALLLAPTGEGTREAQPGSTAPGVRAPGARAPRPRAPGARARAAAALPGDPQPAGQERAAPAPAAAALPPAPAPPREPPPPAPQPPRDSAAPAAWCEPSPAALSALEQASAQEDCAALAALARRERSPVRYEALRRLLRLRGPESLPELAELWEDPDPILAGLLADAYGAGGRAAEATALAERLTRASQHRTELARAVLEIGEREALPPWVEASATRTLAER